MTRPIWYELRRQQQAFSSMFTWSNNRARIGDLPEVRTVTALYLNGDLFGTLGLQPWTGTTVGSAGADDPCPGQRAMVSHGFWMREMGGRPLAASDRVRINGDVMQIVGVTPPSFTGLAVGEQFEVVIPMCLPRGGEQELRREVFEMSVVGRLRPGWTIDRATAHLDALSTGLFEATVPVGYGEQGTKQFKSYRLEAASMASGVGQLRDRYDKALWLLLGMTGLVLLMASANLANLLLARAAARDAEVAIRLALGSSRPALARQFLAECGLLAAMGAVLGVALAQGLSRILIWALSTTAGAPSLTLHLDWKVLGFTAAVAAATCLLFGLAPIARASRIQASSALGARGASQDRGRAAIQRGLVVVQTALSLVLVIGALLFVRSFYRLTTFDPGIRRDGITVAMLGYQTANIPMEQLSATQRELVAAVKTVPGVIEATTTTHIPLIGGTWGHGVTVGDQKSGAYFSWIGPGFFDTMGIRLIEGRRLSFEDTPHSARVAVVNQAFARVFTGRRQPDRQDAPHQPRAQVSRDRLPDRGRLRGHEIRRHQTRDAGDGLLSGLPIPGAGAVGHRDDPLGSAVGDADARGQGAPPRAPAPDLRRVVRFRCRDPRRARRPTAHGDADGVLRRAGRARRRGRDLRDGCVRGRAPPSGTGRPRRAWCAGRSARRDDDATGRAAAGRRTRARRRAGLARGAHRPHDAVRDSAERPLDPVRWSGDPGEQRHRGQLRAGAAGSAPRPERGVPPGVTAMSPGGGHGRVQSARKSCCDGSGHTEWCRWTHCGFKG